MSTCSTRKRGKNAKQQLIIPLTPAITTAARPPTWPNGVTVTSQIARLFQIQFPGTKALAGRAAPFRVSPYTYL